jgi:hypothetical protein
MTDSEPKDPRQDWSALSQAERDAAYDNNKAVADSPALVAARNAASAKVQALHPRTLDVPYGPGERTKFDLYPAQDRSAPCLVFLHGGYWQRNSREDFAMMIEGLAAHGWSVAIPGYSLAPQARDIAGAGLARRQRTIAGHRRSRVVVRMVRGSTARHARAASCRRHSRAGDFRRL